MAESVVVELKANADKFNSELKKAASQADKMGASARKLGSNVESIKGALKGAEDASGKLGSGLGDLTGKTEALNSRMSALGGVAGATVGVIAGVATGVAALGAAIGAMVLASADGQKDLGVLSRQAKTTREDFQALAFATSQYGIEADQIADISKDISDKLGEFATAGTGAFQDFADVMGMTKDQAVQTAVAMQDMSGEQALQYMITQMENAGVSTNKMVLALESMGNDASRLIPLFKDSGAEVERLKTRYTEFVGVLALKNGEVQDLAKVSESFKLLKDQITQASTAISATLAPAMDAFINSVIEVVPQATNAVIDFINTFREAENIQSNEQIIRQMDDINARITRNRDDLLRGEQIVKEAREQGMVELENSQLAQNDRIREQIVLDVQRNEALKAQLKTLEEIEKVQAGEGGEITGVGETPETNGNVIEPETQSPNKPPGMTADELQAQAEARLEVLRQNSMTEREIIAENLMEQLAMLDEYIAITEGNEADYYDRKVEMAADARKRIAAILKQEEEDAEGTQKKKSMTLDQGLSIAKIVNTALLEDNKEVNAGLVVANTAAAIMESLRTPGQAFNWGNVALIAATGAANLATVLSSGRGGGGSPSAPSGGDVITNRPEDFAPETTALEVSAINETDSVNQRVSIDLDGSDEALEALADKISRKIGYA